MHATLIDSSRYVRASTLQPDRYQPTVGPDGRWHSIEHQRSAQEYEYLCDDHTFLGWIPGYDLWNHVASRSHDHSMTSRSRVMA